MDTPSTHDKTSLIKENVDEIRDIMIDNVDKITKNIQSAVELEQKTHDLETGSIRFRQSARKTKWQMIMDNWSCCLAISVVVFVIVVLIIITASQN